MTYKCVSLTPHNWSLARQEAWGYLEPQIHSGSDKCKSTHYWYYLWNHHIYLSNMYSNLRNHHCFNELFAVLLKWQICFLGEIQLIYKLTSVACILQMDNNPKQVKSNRKETKDN